MRLLLLSIVITDCSTSILKESSEGDISPTRYFLFPAEDSDQLFLVDTEEPIDQEFLKNYGSNPDDIGYWLFTRKNPTVPQILKLIDFDNVQQSNFNTDKTTVFLAHGWRSNGNIRMNKVLTEAFLQNDDVNVIVLDWSKLAEKNYVTAKSGVPQLGKMLGQFIKWLVGLNLDYEKTHLVGFSLGGHLVGHAGRETAGLVKRLTALDPAAPLFNDGNRIDKTDGQYVEVIHTNAKMLGYSDPCGHADYYPNGGSRMPNCWLSNCSHAMAWEYMAVTIKYNHLYANQCATVNDAQNNRCTGVLVAMGNSYLNKSRHGVFRVNTQSKYPF